MAANLNLNTEFTIRSKSETNMCKLDIYSTFTPPLQKSKLLLLNKIWTKNKKVATLVP